MQQLFYPGSLVIIGLSSKPSNIPRITLENLLRWGYRGRIFGVNPRCEDVHVDGIRMYKNIEELPEVPDLAFCLIPAKFVPDMVERCGRFGIRRMAIPSGGFSEFSEEGRKLAEDTLHNARRFGIRFVGPNGVTVANTDNGLCLPFVPLHKAPKGGMSIISQSGGVSLMMLNFLLDENVGLSKFASIGNKLDMDEVDFLEYFGKDPHTRIICLYLESVNRGRDFVEAAAKIDKPIVVYKSNTTSAGGKAAMSHTAAVSNDEDIMDSAFEEAGIIRIRNFLDFIEVAKAFQLPPMKGRRIMVMSPAGGFSVITADLCEKAGFEFADMGRDFYEGLSQFSNAGVIKFSNPLDMGDIYNPELTAHVIYSVMHSDRVDGAVFVSQRPQMPAGEDVFHKMFLSDLSKETWGSILSSGKPLGVSLFGPSRKIQQTKRYVEFPVFNSPEEMVNALAIQMNFYARRNRQEKDTASPSGIDRGEAGKWMSGKKGDYGEEVLDLLAAYGVKAVPSVKATSGDEAVSHARELGYPVAMKVISPDALHKSDAGGVMLNVCGPEEVRTCFGTIRENLLKHRPKASFEGVRMQKMAPEGHDMFVGGKHDPSFGPVVFFGMGGIYIEVFRDVANALCPAQPEIVLERVRGLKSYKVLQGLRGKAPGDIDAFVDLVVRVSMLLSDFPNIVELDVNPVRVFDRGQGVMALDARARIA
ncbi:MAG TPA: acetate--CoA ligase family protein [Deltaproteobacteria bacterium]|nr:acetate--CoA ligase family protein [Deltaproteobacteria bacterium]HOI08617.1 acetate--CoA ligase family protein [Deltaproteobacteria bacterium]